MIARHWAGVFRAADAAGYRQHLKDELFPELASISGYRSASILQRELDGDVEFLIITTWDSMEAIKRFAGDNPSVAVVPAAIQQMALRYDSEVRHYEVVFP